MSHGDTRRAQTTQIPLRAAPVCTRLGRVWDALGSFGGSRFQFAPAPVFPETPPGSAVEVGDLHGFGRGANAVELRWSQVDNGQGGPAWYRVKYARDSIPDWKNATIGCERTLRGTEIGAGMECLVEGLESGTLYAFQLMSYRVEDGYWAGAVYSNVALIGTSESTNPEPAPTVVSDLEVVAATASTLTLRWTQVDDGEGNPAWYRVRYGSPLERWKDGAIGCQRTIEGTAIGSVMTCVVEGLEPGVTYDLQLYSYRIEGGVWAGAKSSNRISGTTNE